MKKNQYRYKGEAAKAPYHYTESGLDDVYLLSGYDLHETEYGPGVSVRDAEDLHKAIGLSLVRTKKILSGKELRFLRKEMDLTQSELGKLVGVSDQSVARWEKETAEMNQAADYLFRILFLDHAGEKKIPIRQVLTMLEEHDSQVNEGKKLFEQNADGWQPLAAAA